MGCLKGERMEELTKYCPHCKEWVFHLQGLCPKCNYIFPQTPPKQEDVWEKYAPWNEWKLNPWDKHPWEWNPWESTNNDTSNNDSWNSNPFNNDPWNNN